MKKFLWIAALLAAFALVFTGCPDEGGKDDTGTVEKFDVTFDLNGVAGTPPAKQTIEKGKTAARPATNPSATGFTFVDWFETPVTAENVESAQPFNFSTPINAAKTLYAGWKLDTANYYFVSFYRDPADEHAYRVVPVANDNQSKVAAPSPAPTKTGYTFVDWTTEDEPDIDSVKYNFNTFVTKNFDLYAIWEKNIDVSDIILINEGKGVLEDDFFNVLVKYEDEPAIKIIPNTEISPSMDSYKEYRMTFTFNPSFDITQYGQIDLDIVSDGADPGVVVVSLFMGEDGEERPEKVMVETSTMGGASIVLGDKLHFKSKQLQSIELWASPMLENSPNLYVRKLGVSGTAIPDPEVGTPIPATGIFMAYTKDAASGQKILPLTPGTDGITHEDIKRIYVHFDPLGQDFAAIDIKFTKNAPQGGGNMNIKSAVDASGELQFTGGNDYLGWFGWDNEPFYFADPSTINPAVDKATLRAIGFDFQVDAATPTLELLSVTFLPKGAEPPKDPDPVDELEDQWVIDASVALESIIKVTGVSAAAAGGEISAVELGKLNGVPAVRVLPAEEDKAIRAVFEVAAPYDISGYGKAVLTWQGPPTSSTYVNNGMDIEGVVDPAWVMIRNTGTSPLDILFTQDSPWGSKPLMTTSLQLNGFEIYVDQSKMAAFYILGYEFDTYTPPGGGTDDGNWIVTGTDGGTTSAPDNTVSFTDATEGYIYIYFPPRPAGIAQIVLDFETTGGITLTKQCVYDATGSWGWGWGDVANGSPLDLSGGSYWSGSGDALDRTTFNGICIKVEGTGSFTLNGVVITEMGDGPAGPIEIFGSEGFASGVSIVANEKGVTHTVEGGKIVVNKDTGNGDELRLQVEFNPPIDISEMSNFVLTFDLDSVSTLGAANISFFMQGGGKAMVGGWGKNSPASYNFTSDWQSWMGNSVADTNGMCTGFEIFSNSEGAVLSISSILFN